MMSESFSNPEELLKKYISFPSISADSNYKAGLSGAREFVVHLLEELDFHVEIVETPLHPIVLAKRHGDPTWPHIIIYGHYDVQPADPLNLWSSSAFHAEVRGHRLYGRGAADNKGPQIVHLCALANLLKKQPDLPLNITYLIEGEEEIGSPSFSQFLKDYQHDLSRADFVLVSDTCIPSEDQVVITTGLRGLVSLEVELTGPKSDLHSGLHGGPVVNPIRALADLCSSLHTEKGLVNIEGFYEDVLPVEDWEREELLKFPGSEDEYKEFLDVDAFFPPDGYSVHESVRFAPTLEFNGFGGGYQGEGTKTVIPSKAFVKISCRLVSNQESKKIEKLVKEAIESRVPAGIRAKIMVHGEGNPYVVIPPNKPNTPEGQVQAMVDAFKSAEKRIAEVFGKKPLYLREGGSVPIIADLKDVAGLDSVMIGLFTPEDNLHAPDESFDLNIMKKGILTFEKIIGDLAGV